MPTLPPGLPPLPPGLAPPLPPNGKGLACESCGVRYPENHTDDCPLLQGRDRCNHCNNLLNFKDCLQYEVHEPVAAGGGTFAESRLVDRGYICMLCVAPVSALPPP